MLTVAARPHSHAAGPVATPLHSWESRAYALPEAVFARQFGMSAAAVSSAVAASKAKYYPYFRRGAGGTLPEDLRNHTYFSFATVSEIYTPHFVDFYFLLFSLIFFVAMV
jgi:hypothetical protein